jgi:hypothetical protein
MKSRMTERHLLDVLHNVHYWVGYTRHFGPPSGSDPKLRDRVSSLTLSRYLITVFGYGCNYVELKCQAKNSYCFQTPISVRYFYPKNGRREPVVQ